MASTLAEYAQFDATELAKRIAAGDFTAAEVLQAALERLDHHNPDLNAVILDLRAQAQQRCDTLPDGPFAGVPFLLKDLSNALGGVPRTSGSRLFADVTPDFDSELVKRYKAAGLNIFGKTNTPEFGTMPMTDPKLFGSARNPWNPTRTPGGSSGGSAAAVAAGIVPLANGGDGGGSIRIPASCCGLVGLKPTRARIPVGPEVGEDWLGMAIEHVISRSVRDSAAMLDSCARALDGDPYVAPPPPPGGFLKALSRKPKTLKIAWSTANWLGRGLHPDCVKAVEHSARLLESLGHDVVEADPPIDRERFIFNYGIIVNACTAAKVIARETELGRKAGAKDLEPHNLAMRRIGAAFSAADLVAAREYMHQVGREMAGFMQEYDVLLCSTLGMPPPECGSLEPHGLEALSLQLVNRLPLGKIATRPELLIGNYEPIFDWIPTTPIANASGAPSISLPLYWNDEQLPVGTMFTGRFGDEATLLRLAGQLEQAQPWADRHPPGYF